MHLQYLTRYRLHEIQIYMGYIDYLYRKKLPIFSKFVSLFDLNYTTFVLYKRFCSSPEAITVIMTTERCTAHLNFLFPFTAWQPSRS
jgi:hypothetical protein